MPILIVLSRRFKVSKKVAAALVAADILYWDDDDEVKKPRPHLHLNPEHDSFDKLESCFVEVANTPKGT